MSPREVKAASLAVQLLDGNCRDRGRIWIESEARWLRLKSPPVAEELARTLTAMCDQCPVLELCKQWAELDRYTGIAAGTTWSGGRAGSRSKKE
ncbi:MULTISPECIES: hypothetical protein [Aeromicrobium]|uniref:hypothetical protein n=1 Tax=Aeromicrobium TaxID=2040 RepID=UPI002580DB61|nr:MULTISPECIES: hypothetical protein [Aeromicrobium]